MKRDKNLSQRVGIAEVQEIEFRPTG